MSETGQMLVTGRDVGIAAREQSEMQASVLLALRFPRDERDAYAMLAAACSRPTFAEKARYIFPRGGQKIVGPSVKFAREVARCWRNIRYGYRVVDATDERTTVEGWAFDTETNTRVSAEITFRNLIYRKDGGWIKPDERDYMELVARNGAKMERNAILKIIPADFVEDALEEVKRTVLRAAQSETNTVDRATVQRRIAAAFAEYGVTVAMIEGYLEHPMEGVTIEEMTELRAVLTSFQDGNSRPDEIFDMSAPTPNQAAAASALDALASRMTGDTSNTAAPVPGAAPAAEAPRRRRRRTVEPPATAPAAEAAPVAQTPDPATAPFPPTVGPTEVVPPPPSGERRLV